MAGFRPLTAFGFFLRFVYEWCGGRDHASVVTESTNVSGAESLFFPNSHLEPVPR
jgi:hypothetical protein